jgi:transcription elongation factor GreA-like protein
MKLDPELLQKVKRKRLDEVELEWISRLESTPRDLPWFLAVAREMRAAKAHAKMAELLMLLCDNLALEDAWEEAFDAVREGIALSPRSKELRAKAVDCVRNRYAARDDLEDVIEFFEIETAADPLKAFEEMRDWLRFEPGAGFYLAGRGLGKVSDVNLALQKVQINFEKTAPLVVRRDEAAKLLTWIPSDHFMMRRLEDPETVRAEAKADPGAFMCELLACFARPLSAAEIRDSMSGIVEGARWHSWWARARSHPQVLARRPSRPSSTSSRVPRLQSESISLGDTPSGATWSGPRCSRSSRKISIDSPRPGLRRRWRCSVFWRSWARRRTRHHSRWTACSTVLARPR